LSARASRSSSSSRRRSSLRNNSKSSNARYRTSWGSRRSACECIMTELNLGTHRTFIPEQELMFLADEPVVYHCHHFYLFLDQTIDDGLGAADGTLLRTEAAAEFSYRLLKNLCERTNADTPPERLQLARELFRQLGHG